MKRLNHIASCMIIMLVIHSCAILPAYTPNIKGKHSINSLEKIELGGLKQSILIRGKDTANPLLLFLHGGPGMPAMYLAHSFQEKLEQDFVVVHWDQRGAGKSYRKHLDTNTITVRNYYEDALDLTRYLTNQFHKDKIFLVSHSWGTYLGSILASRNPEMFYAYISIGQVVNAEKSSQLKHAFIEREANQRGRPEALRDLARYGPNAYEKWLFKFGGEIHNDTSYRVLIREGLRSPEYSLFDALKVPKGSQFCSKYMKYNMLPGTIEAHITSYDIPCFFVVGKYDMTTPAPLISSYFEKIRAPDKELFWFDQSAHFPFYEEPGLFAKTMKMIKKTVLYGAN